MESTQNPVVSFNEGFFKSAGKLSGTAVVLWMTYRVGYLKGANGGRSIDEIIASADESLKKVREKAEEELKTPEDTSESA